MFACSLGNQTLGTLLRGLRTHQINESAAEKPRFLFDAVFDVLPNVNARRAVDDLTQVQNLGEPAASIGVVGIRNDDTILRGFPKEGLAIATE
jgi:hypothetical protein